MTIVWRDTTPFIEQSPVTDQDDPPSSPLTPILSSTNLKRLLDTMGQAVFAVDREGVLFLWNQAAENLFGKRRSDVVRQDIRRILDPGDFLHILLDSLNHDFELSGIEITTQCRNKTVTLLVDIRLLRDSDMLPNGRLCVLTDLTPLREQERRLRRYEQVSLTSKIIAGVAHEVLNPIAAIRGFTQLLLEGRTHKDPSTYLSLILDEVDRVNDLVRGFISLARSDGMGTNTVAPDRLVQEVVDVMQGYTFLNGIELQCHTHAGETTVIGDPDQLKLVLLNLVKNAVDSTPPGGKVHITSSLKNGHLQLQVRDNGCGIKSTDLPKVFDLYYTTTNGTGLGLPISRTIVQQHGGTLAIKSIEGCGTTATVTLPLSHGTAAEDAQ